MTTRVRPYYIYIIHMPKLTVFNFLFWQGILSLRVDLCPITLT